MPDAPLPNSLFPDNLLWQVSPVDMPDDHLNLMPTNSKLFAKRSWAIRTCFRFISLSNLNNFFFSKFSHRHSFTKRMPTFVYTIIRVILFSAKEQVVRITAVSHITTMAYTQMFRCFTISKTVCHS